MMRRTLLSRRHHQKSYKIANPSLRGIQSEAKGIQTLKRQGVERTARGDRGAGMYGEQPYSHAWPLLTHTDFGFYENSADTHWVEMASYLPRMGKGLPPWYRGADTYSPLYAEQGRWEYARYTMVARHPAEYKNLFQYYLMMIRLPRTRRHADAHTSLHWLLRMIVDNLNPQHVHYREAMETLMVSEEYDLAYDVWKTMERQQTWPDDKLISQYLQLCAITCNKDAAFECWNRYCTEKTFLKDGEVDPKPVSRTPFSLTREELFHLPKWKKHFDHDPNLDVTDLNRFNTTRNIYRWMVSAMLASGEMGLFETYLAKLDKQLMTSPTPVPEPPNPQLNAKSTWDPYLEQKTLSADPWTPSHEDTSVIHGPQKTFVAERHHRFHSNEQFVLKTYSTVLNVLLTNTPDNIQNKYKFACDLIDRCKKVLGDKMKDLDVNAFMATELKVHRVIGRKSGEELYEIMHVLSKERNEIPHPAHYLEVLQGFVSDVQTFKKDVAKKTVANVVKIVREMNSIAEFTFSYEHHLAVLEVLVKCRTMKGNEYFIANIQRKFSWTDACCRLLYEEYKMQPDVEMWAEQTKRMLVWACRYRAAISEDTKRMIEDDYDIHGIQMRTMQELVVFRYRDLAERKEKKDPASQLPNPLIDRVSHALPFPDRDTGSVDEYGGLGQWRHPNPHLGTKGPGYYAPRMYGEVQRGYHAEWRDRLNPNKSAKLAAPFDRKYKEYAHGKHPSYDMTYAGPMPQIFPNKMHFRRKTRWDFQDIHAQSKFKMHGPI
eukprot:PhM_4_TR2126/c0_g1_i1/m.3147